jgi:putative membrane protein
MMADSEVPQEPRPSEAAGSEPPQAPPPEAAELKRTHPATIAIKTVRSVLQLLAFVIVFGILRAGDQGGWALAGILGFVFLAVVVGLGFSWLSWSYFTYGIVGSDLLIREGVLVKKRRTIPLARIQGVNVRADIFMRALGLVELRVQTAGGGDEPEASIGSIPLADAEVLRAALLRGHKTAQEAAGAQAENPIFGADPAGRMSDFRGALGGAEVAREAPSFEFVLSVGRLVLSAITSKQIAIMILIAFGFSGQFIELLGPQVFEEAAEVVSALAVGAIVVLAILAVLVGMTIAVVVAVVRTWGFSARRVDTRVETEAGLLERRMTSLPVRRVQSVTIDETWLRRLLGYQAVYVETAGFGRSDEDRGGLSKAAIVPLAKRSEIRPLMHGLLPEAEIFPETRGLPRRSLRFYILLPTVITFIIAVPVIAILAFVFPPGAIASGGVAFGIALIVAGVRILNWRAAGIGVDDRAIAVQSGIIGRKRVRLSRSRLQSLRVRQTWFQRRAGLATLTASSVSGSSEATHSVSHIPLADAERVVEWFREGTAAATRPA